MDSPGSIVAKLTTHNEGLQLDAFARLNPNPVLEFKADGTVSYFNEATLWMAQSLGAIHPTEILPPDTTSVVTNCLETGQSRLRIERRIRNRVISWSFFPIQESNVVHCYAGDITERKTAEDLLFKAREELESRVRERTSELARANKELTTKVHELKRTEEALRSAEANYRSIFENAVEGMYQSTPDGRYLNVNPALAKMYGYSSTEELISKVENIAAEIYADSKARLEFQNQVERDGKVTGLEYKVQRKDGRIIWISESARAVKGSDGSILHYEGTIQEITARKEAEAEKERLESQLRQSRKMEAVGTLAGGIAHDFNNILAAILGFTELSLDDLPPGNPIAHRLRQVLKAAMRAKDLVNQILTFSRKDRSERKTVLFDQIIQECLELLRVALPSTIHIDFRNRAHQACVIADATQLHQVLMNLGANAGHAMRETGGTLTIELSETNINQSASDTFPLPSGSYLRLRVSDTGHGMPPEVMERIFTPFFTTKPVGEGTGLGLAVVHGIVTRHDGRISVESELGQGTTFTILLPKAIPLANPEAQEKPPIQSGSGRILFLDDEEALVRLAEERLQRWGYLVTGITSSTDALRRFEANPQQFDLVITDHTLPLLTGPEFGRVVKKVRPDIPVIICTGYSRDISAETASSLGFDAFFLKPLDFGELNRKIMELLSSKRI